MNMYASFTHQLQSSHIWHLEKENSYTSSLSRWSTMISHTVWFSLHQTELNYAKVWNITPIVPMHVKKICKDHVIPNYIMHCHTIWQFDWVIWRSVQSSVLLLSLLLALVLVELQNTCKKKVEQKNARKTQHMLYFWKAGGSRMSNMTFPCVKFRAAEIVGLSPILSWPRIIFSERVC